MQYFFVVYYRFNFNITSFQISSRWWSAPAHSARFSGLLTMVKKKALSMRIPLFALFLCCIMNQLEKKNLSYFTHHSESLYAFLFSLLIFSAMSLMTLCIPLNRVTGHTVWGTTPAFESSISALIQFLHYSLSLPSRSRCYRFLSMRTDWCCSHFLLVCRK